MHNNNPVLVDMLQLEIQLQPRQLYGLGGCTQQNKGGKKRPKITRKLFRKNKNESEEAKC
jgi:hypothetical protein